MPVPPSMIHDLKLSLNELKGIIKLEACREDSVFGSEEDDQFILVIARMIKRHEEIIESLENEPSHQQEQVSDYFMWETICNIATTLLGTQVSQDQIRVKNIKKTIEDYKILAHTVTQIRRRNSIIYALALCGVFKPPRPELDFTLNGHFKNAHIAKREAIQRRAEGLYDSSRTAALIIDFPELMKKNRDKLVGSATVTTNTINNLSRNMRDTLESFLHVPEDSTFDKVVDHAISTTEKLYQFLATPVFAKSRQAISEEQLRIRKLLDTWDDLVMSITETLNDSEDDKQETTSARNIQLQKEEEEVIQEMRIWNDFVKSDHFECEPTRGFLKLDPQALTFASLSTKLSKALDLQVLFWGTPKDDDVFVQREGSFAHVYGVSLSEHMPVLIPTSRYNRELEPRAMRVAKIAVKVIKSVVNLSSNKSYSKENATCARVLRELRIWKKLKHENILPLFGLWVDFSFDGSRARFPVAVSPWVDNGDLHDYLQDNKQISVKDRLCIMRDIVDALAYMHSREYVVIHGDLKANNVLVNKGKVYLCDFGLSRMKDVVTGQSSAVHANVRWAAPELFRIPQGCIAGPTCETDMFSFGGVFLEVLTGDYPWASLAEHEVQMLRNEQISRYPDRPDCISKESRHWDFMRKCWRVEPILRPTSTQALHVMNDFVERETV